MAISITLHTDPHRDLPDFTADAVKEPTLFSRLLSDDDERTRLVAPSRAPRSEPRGRTRGPSIVVVGRAEPLDAGQLRAASARPLRSPGRRLLAGSLLVCALTGALALTVQARETRAAAATERLVASLKR